MWGSLTFKNLQTCAGVIQLFLGVISCMNYTKSGWSQWPKETEFHKTLQADSYTNLRRNSEIPLDNEQEYIYKYRMAKIYKLF